MSRMLDVSCTVAALVIGSLFGCSFAVATSTADLYRARAVVSGQGETNRAVGLARCLEEVLVKVSGDPRLIENSKAVALSRRAADFVASYEYRDRMAGTPIHDEQGSYDRPHDLTVTFDAAKIDMALRTLGRAPWLSSRPRVIVFLAVRGRKEKFPLAGDSGQAPDMRTSLAEAAEKVGLPIEVPTQAKFTQYGWNVDTLPSVDYAKLDAAAKAGNGDVALAGTLAWSDKALGWVVDWRIGSEGKVYQWQVRGVGFDDAFRNGMRGTVQVLSGHGQPK
ncbi:DUF2066 domain-containing protein [Phyllobacterium sp. LjRoot231]|uniref:DUF2066 domain-containing protein n=1 Tax=Phyllobacterium sp. LjRoot231 TaxID=3342289 RepID=UPI003ED0C6B6